MCVCVFMCVYMYLCVYVCSCVCVYAGQSMKPVASFSKAFLDSIKKLYLTKVRTGTIIMYQYLRFCMQL